MSEKLPIVATVTESVAALRHLAPSIARFGWLTLVVMTVQFIVVNAEMAAERETPGLGPLVIALLIAFVLGIVNLPVITSVHRLVLQGPGARAGLALRREEWLFFWSGVRLVPMLLLVALPAGLALGIASAALAMGLRDSGFPAVLIVFPLQLLVAAGIAAFACRYLLIFPAAAIGLTLKLGDAASLLDGNVLRLCLVLVPVWITGWLPQFILRAATNILPLTGALLGACCSTISTMLFAVTLSVVFRRLAAGPPMASAMAARG
jgi:hypothetical protein